VEALGSVADGVVAGFLKNDEYFFLWINNLLKEDVHEDYKSVREIIKFIESKKIITLLDEKLMKRNQIYYSFFEWDDVVISCLYTKINIGGYDCVMTVLGPTRVNYRKNVAILQRVLQTLA
jgi:transcriptional regulator of heat shock response